MLNQSGERTLIPAITPPFTTCINTLTSIIFINQIDLALTEGLFSSLPYDAYIKLLGRNDFYFETAKTIVACHAKRKKLTRKTKKTLLNTTFKSVFYYL